MCKEGLRMDALCFVRKLLFQKQLTFIPKKLLKNCADFRWKMH